MKVDALFRKFLYWTLPNGFYEVGHKIIAYKLAQKKKKKLAVCKNNIQYKDIHKGQRCFILCNGPSINKQDLLPLQNEVVFSVSSGYHHKDYATIKPKYHCVPRITYGKLTINDVVNWFKEMDQKIGDADLFLNYTEESLVKENGLFKDRKVNYLWMEGESYGDLCKIYNLTEIIPSPQSVPIMCLIIAMYMGFKKIYLIGTEHDSFRTGEYKYFYKPTILAGKDYSVTADGKISPDYSLYEELTAYAILWKQYRFLKTIAVNNDISIFNATFGGALDEFERVELETVLREPLHI